MTIFERLRKLFKRRETIKPLTTYKAIEKVIGNKPQNTLGLTFITFLLTILTLPLRLLTLFNKGYSDISDSDWELLLSDDNLKAQVTGQIQNLFTFRLTLIKLKIFQSQNQVGLTGNITSWTTNNLT